MYVIWCYIYYIIDSVMSSFARWKLIPVREPQLDIETSWKENVQQHGPGLPGEKEKRPERLFAGKLVVLVKPQAPSCWQSTCMWEWLVIVFQLLLNPEMVKACPMLIPCVHDFLENKAYSKGKGDFARKVRELHRSAGFHSQRRLCLQWWLYVFHCV